MSRAHSPWLVAWKRLSRNRTAAFGVGMLAVILLACFLAPFYIDYQRDVVGVNIAQRLQFPAEGMLLGADELGRDIFARILWGGRVSLTIGIGSVLIAGLVGTLLGTVAAYYGGRADSLLMRALDVLGERDRLREVIARAGEALKDDPAAVAGVRQLARELGEGS